MPGSSGSALLLHIVMALGAAVAGAAIALLLRQPVIVGYLLAGTVVGALAPGLVGGSAAVGEIANVGIVFLMFAIGVQLSLRELLRASRIAILGGLLQVAVMIAAGYLVGRALGWSPGASYAFGAVLSNSSSTVMGKILSDRGELESRHARVTLAWSSVQDISTVALVALLGIAAPGMRDPRGAILRAVFFFAALVPLSTVVLPWLLRRASAPRNREFFVLVVVTLALAMAAGAAELGVSLALGGFIAGAVIGESDLSHLVLGDVVPLRDVFSGLFFVSIGMLLEPRFVARAWPVILLTVALIVLLKGAVTLALARLLGASDRVAVRMGAAMAQSAEFSFLLAQIGFTEGVLTREIFNVLLSATILTIVLAPFTYAAASAVVRKPVFARLAGAHGATARAPAELAGHAIVCGHGRVGSLVCALLRLHAVRYVVVEADAAIVRALRDRGIDAIAGNAGQPETLDRAQLATARIVLLCMPERMAIRRALAHAHAANPDASVFARTHRYEDRERLEKMGAEEAVVGELELALELGRRALQMFGLPAETIERTIADARRTPSFDLPPREPPLEPLPD